MNVLKLMKIINTKLPPYIWAWIAKYKNHEEQTGSGTLVFENTYGQKFSKFEVYGNTTQDGTPTPTNPVPINNVTGENKIKVENGNLFNINGDINTRASDETVGNNTIVDGKLRATTNYRKAHGYGQKIYVGAGTTVTVAVRLSNIDYSSVPSPTDFVAMVGIYRDESSKNWVQMNWKYNELNQTKTVTITALEDYIIVGFGRINDSSQGDIITAAYFDDIMVNTGSTATPYIPHEEQIITFPLSEGQYMAKGDYLADNGIHHVMSQIVFDGSNDEIWKLWALSGTNVERFYINIQVPAKGIENALCSHFRLIADNSDTEHFRIAQNQGRWEQPMIYISKSKATTVAELKTWLASNPIKIEYELATETIEPYTQAQQEAYDKIKELHTYLDYTQITQTNDGLSFILKVSVN